MATSYATSKSSSIPGVGLRVMSADGKELGIIKESHIDRFQVDAKWAPDYWLGTEVIASILDEEVHLTLPKESIGLAKLRNEVVGPGLGKDAEDFNGPAPADRPQQSL